MARGALRVPSPRLRGRPLAQPAPEGRRVRRLPVHRPALPALRQERLAPERGRGRHLRRARLPDHAAQRAAAADRLPVRALPRQRGDARGAVLQGPGLPALQDRRRLRRRLVPDAQQDRPQARPHRGGDLRGRGRGRRARHLQRQAGDHQLPQGRAPAARRVPRPRAQQGALHRRRTSTSTSTTSSTRPSASGTCWRTTRRSSRASRPPTSRRSRTAPTRRSAS